MLIPLAALTLLATASILGPFSLIIRSLRRVFRPFPAARIQIHTRRDSVAVNAEQPYYTLFLRAFTSIVTSVRSSSPPATLLPVFHELNPPHPSSTNLPPNSPSDHVSEVPIHSLESKPEGVAPDLTAVADSKPDESEEVTERDTNSPRNVTQTPCSQSRKGSSPSPRRVYADFTIGWDDVWPNDRCFPPSHLKLAYSSYYNAFTFVPQAPSPPALDISIDSETESEDYDLDTLDCASDEELISAFHSLTISDAGTSPAPTSPPKDPCCTSPPAGLSPFCPPPIPTPIPPQTLASTTWRLEWY
ncbi:hypothetical protein R3P38DRAFT_3348302 [Favolaschia claudopus]|uniref:Uncharacterized protein n=1 Tax=Favolaschia claudopus TaxID=2862362 RepID=A0AAW0CQI3_9AGAR